jgi:hypothetical protein
MSSYEDERRLEREAERRRDEEAQRRRDEERRRREEDRRREDEEQRRRERAREDDLRERADRERRRAEDWDRYIESRTTDVQYGQADPATSALREYERLQAERAKTEADMRVSEQARSARLAEQRAERFRRESEDAEYRRVNAMIEAQRAEQARDAAALDAARLEIERAEADRAAGERQRAQALADAEQQRLAADTLSRSQLGIEDHPTLRADYGPQAGRETESYIQKEAYLSDLGRRASALEREEYAREQAERAQHESELQTYKDWYIHKRTSDLYEKLKEHVE